MSILPVLSRGLNLFLLTFYFFFSSFRRRASPQGGPTTDYHYGGSLYPWVLLRTTPLPVAPDPSQGHSCGPPSTGTSNPNLRPPVVIPLCLVFFFTVLHRPLPPRSPIHHSVPSPCNSHILLRFFGPFPWSVEHPTPVGSVGGKVHSLPSFDDSQPRHSSTCSRPRHVGRKFPNRPLPFSLPSVIDRPPNLRSLPKVKVYPLYFSTTLSLQVQTQSNDLRPSRDTSCSPTPDLR